MPRKRGSFQKKTKKSADRPDKNRVQHSKENAPSSEEVDMLLEKCENRFEEILIALSGLAGMRESEIAHCRKEWINWQDKVITIPKSQKCSCGECVRERDGWWYPKTEVGSRNIYMLKEIRKYVEEYFALENGVSCSRQTVYNNIKSIAKRTNIKKEIHPHSLRSSFASRLGDMGVSTTTMMNQLGWKLIETANRYCRTDDKLSIKQVKALDGDLDE